MHKYAVYIVCAIVVVVLIVVGTKNNVNAEKGEDGKPIKPNNRKTKLIRSKPADDRIDKEQIKRRDSTLSSRNLKESYDRNGSEGERECRKVLMDIYGLEFPNVRPEWLKNPKTKRCLEIDCYNNDLKIGVEYNGEQHYVYPNKFHSTRREFDEQQYRDMVKIEICRRLGIHLITVPYEVKKHNIRKYITDRLPKHNYTYDNIN